MLAMNVVLEGGVIFTGTLNFEGKGANVNGVEECELLILWSGAMKSIWGIYSVKRGLWQ